MTDPRQERKVVSVVFCDLVGFTSQAESMDPEDVAAILRPYHERVRSELERYGGTVEKFIGDAVMALFGAPLAHEDDPERAVRAAIAIREFAVDEGLELRVGITTGEALVQLDAQPDAGEGMASGDVVNTAARLQSAAPVNGVLVDETTYRATRHAVDYEEAEAVEAKGKTEPIAVWEAQTAHSRFGVDVAHEARAELVGRERELRVIRDAFERARHDRTPQLLTLVGVPGIGKSRLVYELSRIADADPELVTWRQGRCLAYGDGVTLWALSEIVKAQAGIVEQDSPGDVEQKLREAVADVLADTGDANWVESQLRSLVGLSAESELGDDRQQSAFAAWRRLLEAMAEQRPLVVVFEDLHWADESLLDFVDELVDWVTDVPLLAVATARPELLERRPGWGGGKLNATTLALPPLSEEQTAILIAQFLKRSVLPAESQQALLERAGGNPLYAEQFAELFLERGSADELGLPETLQGIIAARLDGLADTEKDLLRDAAVIGKVFWASAVRNGSDPSTTLHSLERKGFVRRQKRSSVEGETEFAFSHALVRDVAYGQIARAERAQKHRGVAEWIEGLGRPEDHAEMLAHHWHSAFELYRAAGMEAAEWQIALAWRFAKRATAPPPSMRIPRPRSTTPRHSLSGRTRTPSGRISCFVERGHSTSRGTIAGRRNSRKRATRCSTSVPWSQLRRLKPFWATVLGTEAIAMPPNDTFRTRSHSSPTALHRRPKRAFSLWLRALGCSPETTNRRSQWLKMLWRSQRRSSSTSSVPTRSPRSAPRSSTSSSRPAARSSNRRSR